MAWDVGGGLLGGSPEKAREHSCANISARCYCSFQTSRSTALAVAHPLPTSPPPLAARRRSWPPCVFPHPDPDPREPCRLVPGKTLVATVAKYEHDCELRAAQVLWQKVKAFLPLSLTAEALAFTLRRYSTRAPCPAAAAYKRGVMPWLPIGTASSSARCSTSHRARKSLASTTCGPRRPGSPAAHPPHSAGPAQPKSEVPVYDAMGSANNEATEALNLKPRQAGAHATVERAPAHPVRRIGQPWC